MSETITEAVRSKYGSVAASGLSTDQGGVRAVAEAFGYTPEELASIPAEANMALSCGNPTATANLREGETVVDLGSGGGPDVFLPAPRDGPTRGAGHRQPAGGRDGRGPGQRRGPRRVPCGPEGRPDRQGDRHRHDRGDDRPGPPERREVEADQRRVPPGDHRQAAAA